MKPVIPYLEFSGNCQEALDYYCYCLQGEVTLKQYYSNSRPTELISHAELRAGPLLLMLRDSEPESASGEKKTLHRLDPNLMPARLSLALEFDGLMEQQAVFDRFAERSSIVRPLMKATWGSRYAEICDPFTIFWRLNCAIVV